MTGASTGQPRPLEWIGSSKKDLMALPAQVVDVFGYALYLAQTGERHEQAKPLKGFGSAGVLEVVEDWRGNAYRAGYTVGPAAGGFGLPGFQEKSKTGVATPKAELDLIRTRLKAAEQAAKELQP